MVVDISKFRCRKPLTMEERKFRVIVRKNRTKPLADALEGRDIIAHLICSDSR